MIRLSGCLSAESGMSPTHAEPGCSAINFQAAISARRADGSFTAYEMTDSSPYRIIRATPNFGPQLTGVYQSSLCFRYGPLRKAPEVRPALLHSLRLLRDSHPV